MELNKQALFKVRGDIHSGEIKKVVENISVTWPLQVLVAEDDGDEVWNLTEGDSVEVGPFKVGSRHCTTCWDLCLCPASRSGLHACCEPCQKSQSLLGAWRACMAAPSRGSANNPEVACLRACSSHCQIVICCRIDHGRLFLGT